MNSCVWRDCVWGEGEGDIETESFIESIKSSSETKNIIKKVGFLNDVSSLSPRKCPHLFINPILLILFVGVIFI